MEKIEINWLYILNLWLTSLIIMLSVASTVGILYVLYRFAGYMFTGDW